MTSLMPRGRQTIRKGGSLTGLTGPVSRPIKLWPFPPTPDKTITRLEEAYMTGLDAVDRIEIHVRNVAASGRFTEQGIRENTLSFALNELIPSLQRARTSIAKGKAELAERRSKLKPSGPEKADAAGAIRRMEIRSFLRQMINADQAAYFTTQGDNLHPDITTAILELPAEFSGVPQSRYGLLRERALSAEFGPQLQAIRELEEAITAAESAVETGRDEIRVEVGGLDEGQFNQLAAEIEAKHRAPWLRRRIENGAEVTRVVDLERRVERPATSEEIEAGIFFKDFDDYNGKDHAA